jgi:hypothetical protein
LYQKAVEEAGGDASQVDERLFRYVGPKPQSRETALLMLADTTEGIVKSKRPNSVEELEKLVDRAVKIRIEQGQLDECDLTLRELRIIKRSFVDTLKGLYHTRVEYPEPKSTPAVGQQQVAGDERPTSERRLAGMDPGLPASDLEPALPPAALEEALPSTQDVLAAREQAQEGRESR